MAEARSAVRQLRVPPDLEEGSWKEFIRSTRTAVVRQFYRTRNSIRNGTWPTSTNNLVGAFGVILSLLLIEPESTKSLNDIIWWIGYNTFVPQGFPKWLQAVLVSWFIAVVFFLVLMKVRQYILRMLLSYRGWMYEPLKKGSMKSFVWAIMVKLVSGYQPSLYSCQRSLPRLPVPPLHITIEKLLESLKPVCTSNELIKLKEKGDEFEQNLGPKLQRMLVLRSWWVPNYVSDWWEKYVYLMMRSPLAINSNYYAIGHCGWSPTNIPVARAASVTHCFLTLKRKIDREELPPLLLRNTIPICMAQYERLYSTTRIPDENTDELIHWDSSQSRHIAVSAEGLYYRLDVYDSRNQLLSATSLEAQLEWIRRDAEEYTVAVSEEGKSIAALTALPRAEWSGIRKKHFADGVNKDTLDTIEKAILVIVLSSYTPQNLSEKGKFLLHGDGKSIWFDKNINIIVFPDGSAGLNLEHTMADAPAIAHIWENCMTKESVERVFADTGHCMPELLSFRQATCRKPVRLSWKISPQLDKEVKNAVTFAQKNNSDLNLAVDEHSKWGKGFIKTCGVSPDAFIQLAIQLAYFKESNCFVQTYEASMTRLYLSGRTETIRSCTSEAAQFVRAMMDKDVPAAEKLKLLKLAGDRHQQLSRDSMNGMGIDRHLFALYVCCKGMGYKSDFLEDIITRPWILSTSQQPQQQEANVPDPNLDIFQNKLSPGGGFGPVNDNGYGISYMIPCDSRIFFHVSSKYSSEKTNSDIFLKLIFESLEDMRNITLEAKLENGKV